MKKLLLGIILLPLIIAVPITTFAMGRVDVGVSIPLPPPFVFAAPPEVVVIPETYVYAVPDIDVDFFFYNGWWWRPWQGRWYRSQNYNSGWSYYQQVPSFYRGIPSGWRNDYREHRWKGHQWNYQRIPHQQVQRNWNNWEKSKHWEKQNTWGVHGLRPGTKYLKQNREVQPQRREAARPQQQRPQSREVRQQHSQPQYRETPQQSRQQSGKAQRQNSQQQGRKDPQQDKSQHGKHERGNEDKHDRSYNDY
ncbi:MAG: hypothetical protein ABIK92_20780 [Pseudomonadota bacterium]